MSANKSSISDAKSYLEIGEFWDTHDLADYWDQTKEVNFEVDIRSQKTLYAVDPGLSAKMSAIAKTRGVSPEKLLNMWIERNVSEEIALKS